MSPSRLFVAYFDSAFQPAVFAQLYCRPVRSLPLKTPPLSYELLVVLSVGLNLLVAAAISLTRSVPSKLC